ncbi:uncharacterized protein LOC114189750 [Vigna unguiculata]|uniref:uncharacterized protein LOC114189750 n=1 Tax=Vigna unguiculata TaxID=3917 RepID=UPI001016CD3B|nr:uncharacterized protein LOC114189750 [Vigna unguiculata]
MAGLLVEGGSARAEDHFATAAGEEKSSWTEVAKLVVSRHHFYRRTRRWESHIWDCGKQVYLGEVAIRGFVLDYVFHLSSLSTRGSGRQKRPEEEREGLVRRTWGATSLLVTTWASPKRLMLSGSSLGAAWRKKIVGRG